MNLGRHSVGVAAFNTLVRLAGLLLLCLIATASRAEITLEGISTTGDSSPATSLSLSVPAGAVEGDVMIAQVAVRHTSPVTAPAGWTLVRTDSRTSGPNLTQRLYVRVAGPTEPPSYAWTFASTRAAGGIALFRGVDPHNPVSVHAGQGGSGTTLTAPSVLVSIDGSRLLTSFASANGNTALGLPSGMGQVFNHETGAGPNGAAIRMAGEIRSPGNTGVRQASGPNTNWIAQALVLRPLNLGLAAHWRMEEPVWSGAAGEVQDSSGNGRHGTAIGSAQTAISTPAIPGDPGTCRYGVFDGSSAYVEVPGHPNLTGTSALTYTAWIRPNTWSGTIRQVMAKSVHGGGAGRAQMGIFSEDGVLKGRAMTVGGHSTSGWEVSTALPATGQWTHVALVFAPTSLTLYVNGASAATLVFPVDSLITNGDPLRIGNDVGRSYEFSGLIDEVRVYRGSLTTDDVLSVMNATHPCETASPHHIRLLHDGQGLTCMPESVVVQACADAECTSLFADPVVVTLLTAPAGGVWSPNPVTVNGSASVALRYTTPGTVNLQVAAVDPPVQSALRCFSGGVETCDMVFSLSGFEFDFTAAEPMLAGRVAQPVTISALSADPAGPGTCAPAFSGARDVGMWFDYADPGTGTLALSVDGVTLGSADPGTAVSLVFDDNAQAQLALLYQDAGLLTLHARFDGQEEEAGLVMTGSGQFVVRPAGLCVDTPAANADCDPASPSCSVFRRAGEQFPLRVSAVAWRDDDGGDLCMNRAARVTPNFRLNNIPLTSEPLAPLPGVGGVLAVGSVSLTAADAGVAEIPDQEISEVGVFRVSASPLPGTYHGVDVNGGLSDNLGRFTPYDFQVVLDNSPEFEAACGGGFTYMSQWFGYATAPEIRITARNRHGVTTRNYDGAWWRLTDIAPDYAHAGQPEPLPVGVSFVIDASHDAIDCASGGCQGEVVVGFAGEFTYERNGTPVDPVNGQVQISFTVEDGDGVVYGDNPFRFDVDFPADEDEQRWGRLEMGNAHGPELLPLTVPMYTSYFRDGGFRINLDDSCTALDAGHLNPDIQLSGGTSTATVLSSPAVAGRLDVNLTAPGAGNTGYVDLRPDLSVSSGADLPWLQFDWDGDGNQRGPEGRATFGVFGGNERQIYIRELP
ncbi:DUF6701 domain-containing protein [Thioalkalivibrio sulfidiphilus]|uniref:DUF6701 domain-containing protein n=1 Tax=Thioalkalivibrio sulfidiphilus TaxID=1033854 RepID=UPI003BAEB90F